MSTPETGPPGDSRPDTPPAGWRDAAGYLAVALVSLASFVVSWEMWNADLRAPLCDIADSLFSQLVVKNVIETGWYHQAPRLGAPGEQNLLDFPNADALHLGLIRLLGCFSGNHAAVFNAFVLLMFPLAGLSSYFVLRRFGLDRLEAVVAGALYACAPYHIIRFGHHMTLCGYFVLPLAVWLAVRLYLGWDPLRASPPDGGVWSRRRDALGAVLVCVLTGMAGIYYAFFSCFLLLAAGVRTAVRERRWRALLAPALLVTCVAASVVAGTYPALAHRAREGKNPAVANRSPVMAEMFAMKASEMLIPLYGHRLRPLREFRARWFEPDRPSTESARMVPLGVLASAGFLLLVGRFLWWRPVAEGALDALAYLTAMALALASVGGLGAFFAYFVSPLIRCYDRMSILVAFFSVAGLFLSLGSAARAAGGAVRAGYPAVLVGLLLVGMYDQTARPYRQPYPALRETFASDRDFGRRMEAALRPGSMVYQLPYMVFPEAAPVHALGSYEQFRPYFHTRTLRWSYGAVDGRATAAWLEAVGKLPLPEAIERLALAGFEGIHIDRRGFADRGAATEADLTRLLGVAPLVSDNGLQTFFDMTRYAQNTHDRLGDREWEERRAGVSAPVPVARP